MIKEIANLGFEHVELSHGIRLSLVPGILKALNERLISVASLHNFCPLPVEVRTAAPNWRQPSATSHWERDQWIRQTVRTIEFANKVEAPYVVLHSGSSFLALLKNVRYKLEKAVNGRPIKALWEDPSFLRLRETTLMRIRKKAPSTMERVRECFERVLPSAQANGVRLGIENRAGLLECPMDADMADFVAELAAVGPFGYWHDTGHAAIKQQLGLIDAYRHLEENAALLFGFHLHDTSPSGEDHQALGTGVIDFQRLRPFLGSGRVLTLELSPKLSPSDVTASRDFLLRLLEIH